jgi:NADP-dependent 3-hydroxy acid dehydrogenase YdfG
VGISGGISGPDRISSDNPCPLPHLRQTKGNVISAGSEAGVNGQPRNTPYGGTNAFLHAFMMGVAVVK